MKKYKTIHENAAIINPRLIEPISVGSGTASITGNFTTIVPNGTEVSSTFNLFNEPVRIEVNEYSNRIEMIYKETAKYFNTCLQSAPEDRVFKIVFSCIDGIWNKSERIYGTIIRASSETYDF